MKFEQKLLAVSVASALLVLSGNVAASGFALIEQSGSGLGNAFAGGAASAEDASTIFYNPAGMSRLSGNQVTVAGSFIKPSATFSDAGSTAAALQTQGGNGGDAGSLAFVPNAYLVMQANDKLRYGLGINSPFGLQTQYDSNWMGRFQALQSKIQTININPSVSYQFTDALSVGAGVSYQHISGTLSSAVNYSALAGGALGTNVAGVSTISGNDAAWGYNLGGLWQVNDSTRVGAAYRSKVMYNLTGTVSFSGVPAALAGQAKLQNGAVSLPITMPDSFSVSGFHQLSDKWDLMGDATWTGWSVFQQLQVNRSSGVNVSTVQENWSNTWRVAVGTSYHYSEQWTARTGIALDQSPVSDTYRTARIPDNNRTWLSFGGQYKASKSSTLDFGYAHLFVNNASISQNQTAGGAGNLIGTYSNSVDIASVQYAYSF